MRSRSRSSTAAEEARVAFRTVGRGTGPKPEKESRNLLIDGVSGNGTNGAPETDGSAGPSPSKLFLKRSVEGLGTKVLSAVIGSSSVTDDIYTIKKWTCP